MLPRYDHASDSNALPFCVSAGAWFQIVDAFRPKTEDFDQSFADLLASPYVRFRRTLSQRAASQIVARINQFKDATSELATRVFMNSAAMDAIEEASDDADQIQKIDSAILAAAKQAQGTRGVLRQ